MELNEYLKIKNKYEGVLYELMKTVSNELSYEDTNKLYKEMALSLITASLDFDNSSLNELLDNIRLFTNIMVTQMLDTYKDIRGGKFNGKVIKHYND